MRSLLHLTAPILLLIVSILLLLLGAYIYGYRDHLHTTDPTSYHANDAVSLSILIPSGLAFLISLGVVIQRSIKLVRQPSSFSAKPSITLPDAN